jgi:sensor c-di-GMP phosphodiesterase-like protein
MDMVSGTCVGAEALARWRVEDGAWVGPDVFIPLAERVGLIGQVTLAVMTTVFRELAPLLRDGSGFSVNVNLASEDLLNERFASALASGLARHGIEPSSVKLEITERALITSEAARKIISELRQRGHQVVIDDFGTGYSSLSYLERLELDALKIDKSFVDGIGTGAVTGGVIGHIIEMAGSLGLGLVAEGIENAEQVDWLLARGVRFGQGFRYSKPLEAASFIAFRQARSLQVLAPRAVRLVSGGATGGSV